MHRDPSLMGLAVLLFVWDSVWLAIAAPPLHEGINAHFITSQSVSSIWPEPGKNCFIFWYVW